MVKGVEACFGAITSDSESFERQDVDGILGLADGSLACSPTCINPVFDEALAQKKVDADMFTVCLDSEGGRYGNLSSSCPEEGGPVLPGRFSPVHFFDPLVAVADSLTLGGIDKSAFKGDITWLDMQHSRYYEVDLSSTEPAITIGDNPVQTSIRTAVVDTGKRIRTDSSSYQTL